MAVATAFALQGLTFAAVVTQTPRQQDRFGLGEGDVTLILVVVAVVAGIGSTLAGVLAARRSSAVALTASLVGIGLGATLVGLAPSFPLLVVAFACYGLALGGVDAMMNVQGVRLQARRGTSLMTGFHAWWSVGGVVGAGYAALAGRLDAPLAADLALVGLVVVGLGLGSRRHLVVDAGAASVVASDRAATRPVVPWRPVLLFGFVICLYYAADTGTATWCSVFLDDTLDASAGVVPLAYAGYQAGGLVSRLGGDLVVRRLGAAPVVAAGAATGALGYAGVLLAPTPVTAVAAFVVVGFGLAVITPLAFAALAGSVPDDAVDEAVARMNVANYVGAILGGGLIGAVAGAGALHAAFAVPLAMALAILLLARSFRPADAR